MSENVESFESLACSAHFSPMASMAELSAINGCYTLSQQKTKPSWLTDTYRASQCFPFESNIFAQMVRLLGSTALLHGYMMIYVQWTTKCDEAHVILCRWSTHMNYRYIYVPSSVFIFKWSRYYSLSQSCLAVVISLPARPTQLFKTSGWAHPSRGRLHSVLCVCAYGLSKNDKKVNTFQCLCTVSHNFMYDPCLINNIFICFQILKYSDFFKEHESRFIFSQLSATINELIRCGSFLQRYFGYTVTLLGL